MEFLLGCLVIVVLVAAVLKFADWMDGTPRL